MKVLVTGAAGFIGSNLAAKLLQRGDQVVGLDNFNNYYSVTRKWANVRSLEQQPNFRMVEADICDRQRIMDLFDSEQFDAVAHLAGMAGVRYSVAHPELYTKVNIQGSQNLMDAIRASSSAQNFVFASTSTVYGETRQIPFVETDPADHPPQPYAATKRAVELLGHTYHQLFQLNFTVTRFFSVYGPRNRPDMMAYLVLESITKGKEIPLYQGGKMYRDWTFVDDITDGITLALDRPMGFEIFNLGRGEPILLNDFVSTVEKLAGRKANTRVEPKLAAEVDHTYADISKARRLLGYEPKVSIADGIKELWDWYCREEL